MSARLVHGVATQLAHPQSCQHNGPVGPQRFLSCWPSVVYVRLQLFLPGYETQATWLRDDNGTPPALERLLKKSPLTAEKKREKPLHLTAAVLFLKGGARPSFQLSDCTQRTKNRRTQTGQHTLKRSDKGLQTTHSQIYFRNFRLSLTLLLFFSVTTCPSTMRERLSLAVTVDFPGSRPSHSSARESSQHSEHSEQGEPSDSELSQHASPHFLAKKVHGRVTALGHSPKLPVLEKRAPPPRLTNPAR